MVSDNQLYGPGNGVVKTDQFDPKDVIGATGLRHFSGIVTEELTQSLQGYAWRVAVREMLDNEPVIAASILTLEMLMRQVSWRVQPGDESAEAKADANYIRECLFEDMSHTWTSTLIEILSFLWWGWSWLEIVYKDRLGDNADASKRSKFSDGRVAWRKWSIRSQDSLYAWEFDTDGGIRAMVQQAPPAYQIKTIPIEKSLHFVASSRKGNPEGRSLLRGAWSAYKIKKGIQQIEAVGIERDLAGLPVIWVPPEILSDSATASQVALRNLLKDIVTRVKRNEQEGMLFPLVYNDKGLKEYDFTLLSTGGTRQFDVDRTIKRLETREAMALLCDFIMVGHEQVGSFGMHSDKTNILGMAVHGWLEIPKEVINNHAIPRLLHMAGRRPQRYPTLEHSDVEDVALAEISAYIRDLSGAGLDLFPSPDGELERELLRRAKLPATVDMSRLIGASPKSITVPSTQSSTSADSEESIDIGEDDGVTD